MNKNSHHLWLTTNAWNYISRWVGKHKNVYCVNTQEPILLLCKIMIQLEGYTEFSILYSEKEDVIYHCEIFYEYQNKNYRSTIKLINEN